MLGLPAWIHRKQHFAWVENSNQKQILNQIKIFLTELILSSLALFTLLVKPPIGKKEMVFPSVNV